MKAVHPGETLNELMKENDLSIDQVVRKTEYYLSRDYISNLLMGKARVTQRSAMHLGRAFSLPVSFWLKNQENYDMNGDEQDEES